MVNTYFSLTMNSLSWPGRDAKNPALRGLRADFLPFLPWAGANFARRQEYFFARSVDTQASRLQCGAAGLRPGENQPDWLCFFNWRPRRPAPAVILSWRSCFRKKAGGEASGVQLQDL